MKVSDRLIALLKPLFPRDATLKPVDNEGDETIVRVEWPGDQRAVEARVAAFVKQQLANFRPRDDIAVQTWTVAGPAVPPMGSARGLL